MSGGGVLLIAGLWLAAGAADAWRPEAQQLAQAKRDLREYIAQRSPQLAPRYRPHYHVAPPVGWLSDPDGLIYFKGEYHVFYQYHPYSPSWGRMHWGHSVSPDLVHWRSLPTALIPEIDKCFSGCAVIDGDVLVLMYTARVGHDANWFEKQHLAYSHDGVDFTKYDGNPVLEEYPYGLPEFRDPKIWKHEDYWYLVIGSKTDDGRGRVLMYRSKDLTKWEFLKVFGESGGNFGYMWECPDMFELEGRYVFLWSPQGMTPDGDKFKNQHQTGYIIGEFNYNDYDFVQQTKFQELDYGHDFYTSHTMEHNGRRYVIGWFNTWERTPPEQEDGWAGILTMVRELRLHGDMLLQKPVEQITTLRQHPCQFDGHLGHGQAVEFEQTAEIFVSGDLEQDMVLQIAGAEGGEAEVRWDARARKVAVERAGDVRQVTWAPVGTHSWRIFLDASSLELFCGEGEVVFSTRVYPTGNWRVTNRSPQPLRVKAYKLKPSLPQL